MKDKSLGKKNRSLGGLPISPSTDSSSMVKTTSAAGRISDFQTPNINIVPTPENVNVPPSYIVHTIPEVSPGFAAGAGATTIYDYIPDYLRLWEEDTPY